MRYKNYDIQYDDNIITIKNAEDDRTMLQTADEQEALKFISSNSIYNNQ